MEFRRGHLLYFVTVAEDGQITGAARKLHLAQPALSQAIAQLESDLGVELLERHARGVTLTAAGEAFLAKARVAVSAWADAVGAAQSLTQAGAGTIEFGFVGSPPGLDSPGWLRAFARAHPRIDLRYRELPFPSLPTTSWLAEVDLAVCHLPAAHPDVWTQVLRREPRAVLVPRHHPLARRTALATADVVGEAFIGLHPSVDPHWAGFWSLDDHRGRPPRHVTPDRARNAQEVLAALATRRAIITVPASFARIILSATTGVRAFILRDAQYATFVLSGREDRQTANVAVFRNFVAKGQRHTGGAPSMRGSRPR